MPHQPAFFSIVDPRTFDGNPYESAGRAVKQIIGLLDHGLDALEPARIMVRNAELERQLALDGECDAVTWEEGPQARMIHDVEDALEQARRKLSVLKMAAEFDPKAED